MDYTRDDLMLLRSDTGDGGWSLHTKDAVILAEASGDVPETIISGHAEWIEENDLHRGHWNRPNWADYEEALAIVNGLKLA